MDKINEAYNRIKGAFNEEKTTIDIFIGNIDYIINDQVNRGNREFYQLENYVRVFFDLLRRLTDELKDEGIVFNTDYFPLAREILDRLNKGFDVSMNDFATTLKYAVTKKIWSRIPIKKLRESFEKKYEEALTKYKESVDGMKNYDLTKDIGPLLEYKYYPVGKVIYETDEPNYEESAKADIESLKGSKYYDCVDRKRILAYASEYDRATILFKDSIKKNVKEM